MQTIIDKLIYFTLAYFPTYNSKRLFKKSFGYSLNLKNPNTLNEKLMWLKLNIYANNELVTICTDKYRVRDYVTANGCGDILNELYYSWDDVRQIDWETLPNQFVIKCNHGCGYNIICFDKEKLDIVSCKRKLEKWMKTEFWRFYSELQYKGIQKKIICEKLLGNGELPLDYKVYCFNGKPRYILTCVDRQYGIPKFYFFDCEWNFQPITRDGLKENEEFTLQKPKNLSKIIEYAEKLSKPFPFVRVDFYDVDGNITFGEMTFTPSACLDTGRLPETDILFGNALLLHDI